MQPRFRYGDPVRVIHNIRNDGTFPGRKRGTLLVPRGETGFVRDVGTFLQDQIVYSIDFIDLGIIVGCRDNELIASDQNWHPGRFQFRDTVQAKISLAINGEIQVQAGHVGQIESVLQGDDDDPLYEVRFPKVTLLVPEKGLLPIFPPSTKE